MSATLTKFEKLEQTQRSAWYFAQSIIQRLKASNARLIREHLSSGGPKRLHLGAGEHVLPGWLNTDVRPSAEIAYLDLTGRFPFPDNSFDYVYSEHVIEHLGYEHGRHMLQESRRVLRPGGAIRVVTPDFEFLKALHNSDKTELQKAYIRSSAEEWLHGDVPAYAEMHVINNFVRAWGHQFIYDEKSLTDLLASSGFDDIRTCELLKSDHPVFCRLEHDKRMPDGFLRLESLVIEAMKPLSGLAH